MTPKRETLYTVECPRPDCDFAVGSTNTWADAFNDVFHHHFESHPEEWRTTIIPTPKVEPMRVEDAWDSAVLFMDTWNRVDKDRRPIGGNRIISGTMLFDKTLELARFLAGDTDG